VVLDELGKTLFKRALQEESVSERDPFLRHAVGYYERTLQIDTEDLDAHYGLAQCFALLGENMPPASAIGTRIEPAPQALLAETRAFADVNSARERRLQAAENLCQAIVAFGRLPTQADKPKLSTLLALIGHCRPVFDTQDAGLQAAAAKVLGTLYRQTHAIYKPDDNAADRAVRIYREKHPAAAAASQAIVIYPTDR
jgi:hypothetical protein